VRLKGWRKEEKKSVKHISIPFGAIKRQQQVQDKEM